MPIEDYYKTLRYVTKTQQPDGTGGFEYAYVIGKRFKGSVVKTSSQEQIIAGVRNNVAETYRITTSKSNKLLPDDMIMFIDDDCRPVFLRINSNALYTPESSKQKNWKGFTADVFRPDLRVVDNGECECDWKHRVD